MLRIQREGFKRAPWWLRLSMPFVIWRMKTACRSVYLTFDDGPTAGVTEKILEILDEYGAKATFFCLGKQAEKHPELLRSIYLRGHTIGNHSFSHLNGWSVSAKAYTADIDRADQVLTSLLPERTNLFRPPYGRITPSQWYALRINYRICMWDITAQDFLTNLDSTDVLENIINHATLGSIVLLHDSELAAPRVLNALPQVIETLIKRGFRLKPMFRSIHSK